MDAEDPERKEVVTSSVPSCSERFRAACEEGDIETFDSLIQTVDPSVNSNECLRTACSVGNIEIVRRLLKDARVNPEVWSYCPLRWVEQENLPYFQDLLVLLAT